MPPEELEPPDVGGRIVTKDYTRGCAPSADAAVISSVRVVTYNIHTCVGVDRRYDPGRIGAVLREIDADIACLQEVGVRRRIGRQADQWAFLSEVTGCRVIAAASVREHGRRFGNA